MHGKNREKSRARMAMIALALSVFLLLAVYGGSGPFNLPDDTSSATATAPPPSTTTTEVTTINRVPNPSLEPTPTPKSDALKHTAVPRNIITAHPGQRIPKVIHLSWKTTALPKKAQEVTDVWNREETEYTQQITTDEECAALAKEWPRLYPLFMAQKMKVMKADTCRYLIIYKYGGLYRDLDVAHVRPLKEWFNHELAVVYGHEDEHLCQWFFAAEPRSPCLASVIEHVTDNLARNVSLENAPPGYDVVIDGTGPGAFTVGMRNCPTKPTLTPEELVRTKVKHEFAGMNWRGDYDSWLVQRQKVLGWSDIFPEKDKYVRPFYFAPSAKLLAPLDNQSPLPVTAWQTSHRWGEVLKYYPARHAIDRDLDTFVMTENSKSAWALQFHASSDALIVRPAVGELDPSDRARAIMCARVWNKRRTHDSEFFHKLRLKVVDVKGQVAFESEEFGGEESHFNIKFNGQRMKTDKEKIDAIVIERQDGTVLFSEIELFADGDCRGPARSLQVTLQTDAPPRDDEKDFHSYGKRLSAAFRAITARCTNATAVSWEDRFQFTWCLSWTPRPCAALSIAAADEQPDMQMLRVFLNHTCQVTVVTERSVKDDDKVPGVKYGLYSKVTSIAAAITAHAPETASPISVLHVALGPRNWNVVDELIDLALAKKVVHLLVELCAVSSDGSHSTDSVAAYYDALRRLHSAYSQYAWHVTPRTPMQRMGDDVPACNQLSLVNSAFLV